MRISDWSSDGCSSDLDDVRAILNSLGANGPQDGGEGDAPEAIPQIEIWNKMDTADVDRRAIIEEMAARRPDVAVISAVTGDRKSVVWGKSGCVRVGRGGGRTTKKKKDRKESKN